MRQIWFISDPHFFHKNILSFTNFDGSKTRPFETVEEMHDCILTNHNELVKDGDVVYWLGDITFNYREEFASLFSKFKGRKRLIPGNHDEIKRLVNYFQKVQVWRVFNEKGDIPFTCSHVPLHLGSVKGYFNVHGHTHWNLVESPHYVNVCVERTGYKPISYDELQERMRKEFADLH